MFLLHLSLTTLLIEHLHSYGARRSFTYPELDHQGVHDAADHRDEVERVPRVFEEVLFARELKKYRLVTGLLIIPCLIADAANSKLLRNFTKNVKFFVLFNLIREVT